MPKSLGVAAALAAFPPTGLVGGDKYYVAWGEGKDKEGKDKTFWQQWKWGLIQTLLTISFVGLLISVPWMYLSTFVLVIAVLWRGIPHLYPQVEWAPVSSTDSIVVWIIVVLYILSMIGYSVKESYMTCKKCKKKNKNCKCTPNHKK